MPSSVRVRIGGLDLNVRSAGSGAPFVWAHGWMSSMETEDDLDLLGWQHFPASLRLVRYDARGHGASAACASATWQELGQDMLSLADTISANNFIAGGWSMGCASALHAALHAPDRIDALVLVLPPTLWEARAVQAALYRRALGLARTMGAVRFARLLASDAGATFPPWLLQAAPHVGPAMRDAMRRLSPATLPALFEGAAASDLPARAALAALAATPALIVGWADDPVHPLASAHELHRLLPKSSLFIAHDYHDVLAIPARVRGFVQAVAASR